MRRALGVALAVATVGGCGSSESSDDTLPPVGTFETTPASGPTVTTPISTAPSGPTGSGVVRIAVRLEGRGIVEELLLDRSTVTEAELDPIALDATCTAIDGGDEGDGLTVSVVDLRRLRTGQRLLSATLVVPGEAGPGEHTGTLEVGDAAQQTARFEGRVVIDQGAASGAFELQDSRGASATGAFACGADVASLPTTTTVPPPTIPPDSGVDDGTGTTIVIQTAPPPTVPQATS